MSTSVTGGKYRKVTGVFLNDLRSAVDMCHLKISHIVSRVGPENILVYNIDSVDF